MCNLQVLNLHGNKHSEVGATILAEKLLQLDTIVFIESLDLIIANKFLSLRHQKNKKKTPVILPQQNLHNSTVEIIIEQYYYYIISAVLGLVIVVLMGALFYKLNVNRNTSTELDKALGSSSFSVSKAWKLHRLANLNLNGTGTCIAILYRYRY